MLENEFEKKVQHKMEEFRLRPSDEVWGRVEDELRKKKKRRVVFFIFLMAGLSLLSYTGYFLLYESKQNIVEQISTPSQKESSLNSQETKDQGVDKEPVEIIAEDKAANRPNQANKTATDKQSKKQRTDRESTVIIAAESKPLTPVSKNQEPTVASSEKSSTKLPEEVTVAQRRDASQEVKKVLAAKKEGDNANKPGIVNIEKNKKDVSTAPGILEKVADELKPVEAKDPGEKKDTAQIDKAGKALADLTDEKNKDEDSADIAEITQAPVIDTQEAKSNLASKSKRQSKIKWGFDFSIGAVDGRESALPFSDDQGNQSLDSYNNYAPTQGFPGGAAYFPPVPPSPVNPGLGFKIGPAGEMELSKRSRLAFGIQYAYMSNKMMIGSYTNTALVINNTVSQSLRVDAVYRGTYQREHTNHYHFIQVPITYHLQLNKGKKLPITWNVGASAGYLLATNGLFYDTAAGGIYYRDMKAYNKFQFNLHSGFAFRFGNNKRIQWSVGPEFSVNMNKLVNDQYTKKQYLMYGGLTGRLIFSKKK